MTSGTGVECCSPPNITLPKAPTGIQGLDEITRGGLPKGRPTLVCGGAGCGKTLFGMQFLVSGALEFDEPGVFVSFEESKQDLIANVASLGIDLDKLVAARKIALDHVSVSPGEIEETGEYGLDGLFIRLGYAIDSVGAKRVVLDSIETLFAALPSEGILRAELHRLFRWLKERGVTAVITGERGERSVTRHGLEEYISDCVILLEQRVIDRVATRYLRVLKYRGSYHGSNEYPFLIQQDGFSVFPITSLELEHKASLERVSLGIPRLDAMLGGMGVYRGTSVLVSGVTGSGKSSIAAHALDAACQRGERCLYLAFEESSEQIIRNMRSIGLDLERWVKDGLLRIHSVRPTLFGLETHLATMHRLISSFEPRLVAIDPITNFLTVGSRSEVRIMLMRLIDFLKSRQMTTILNSLTSGAAAAEQTEVGISSMMDTWLLLRFVNTNGERNRCIYVLKSRGMAHSNQVREFVITSRGIDLVDVYIGLDGVLTGSARHAQEIKEEAERRERQQLLECKQREFECKRQSLEAQIMAMRAQLDADAAEITMVAAQERLKEVKFQQDREEMAVMRQGDTGMSPLPNEQAVEMK